MDYKNNVKIYIILILILALQVIKNKARASIITENNKEEKKHKEKKINIQIKSKSTKINLKKHETIAKKATFKVPSIQGSGAAQQITLNDEKIQIKNGNFTLCPKSNPIWNISATNISIDREKEALSAQYPEIEIYGNKIMTLPFLNLDIGEKKNTGFLFPQISTSSIYGKTIKIPFYYDVADFFNIKLTPIINIDQSGLISTESNILLPYASTKIEYEKAYEKNQYAINITSSSTNTENIFYGLKYKTLGENDYFKEFNSLISGYDTDKVNQEFSLSYNDKNWQANILLYNSKPLYVKYTKKIIAPEVNISAFRYNNLFNQDKLNLYHQTAVYLNEIGPQFRFHLEPSYEIPLYTNRDIYSSVTAKAYYTGYIEKLNPQYKEAGNDNNNSNLDGTDTDADTDISINTGKVEQAELRLYTQKEKDWYKNNAVKETKNKIIPEIKVKVESEKFYGKFLNNGLIVKLNATYTFRPYIKQDDISIYDSYRIVEDYLDYDEKKNSSGVDRITNANNLVLEGDVFHQIGKKHSANFNVKTMVYFNNNKVVIPDHNDYTKNLETRFQLYYKYHMVKLYVNVKFDNEDISIIKAEAKINVLDELTITSSYNTVLETKYNEEAKSQLNAALNWNITEKISLYGSIKYNNLDRSINNLEAGIKYTSDCLGASLSYKEHKYENMDKYTDESLKDFLYEDGIKFNVFIPF